MSSPLDAVVESALELGMDEDEDEEFFYIAEEYLNVALPKPWQMLEVRACFCAPLAVCPALGSLANLYKLASLAAPHLPAA